MNKWIVLFFGLWAGTTVGMVTWAIVSRVMEEWHG